MLNLVPAIHELDKKINTMQAEFDKAIEPYKRSLEELRKLNEACERCNGKGRILRSRSCAEDDRPDPNDPRDYNKCPECRGTGLAHYKDENANTVHVDEIDL